MKMVNYCFIPYRVLFGFLLMFCLQPFQLLSQSKDSVTSQLFTLVDKGQKLRFQKSYDSSILLGIAAVKLAETNNRHSDPLYHEALLLLGTCYQYKKEAAPAHEYYTKALRTSARFKNSIVKRDAFIALNQLHSDIIKNDWSFNYTPPTTTIAEDVAFTIEKVNAKGDSLELIIYGGRLDGITDSSFTTYVASRSIDSVKRSFRQIGTARITNITANRTIAIMPLAGFKVLPGDLAFINVQLPVHLNKSVLKRYIANSLFVTDNYRQQIYDRRYMYYFFDEQTDSTVMDVLKYTVDEIVEAYGADTLTEGLYAKKIPEGIFAGKNVMRSMHQSTNEHLEYFLNFLSEYPAKYIGNNFKFSEIYATWVISNAPLVKRDVKKFLLQLKGNEREQQAYNLRNTILNENLNEEWVNEALVSAGYEDLKSALQNASLLKDVGAGIPAARNIGWYYYINALCQAKNDNISGADSLYKIAEIKFKQAGDDEGRLWAKSATESLKKEVAVSFNVQSGHLMSYTIAMSPNPRYFATGSEDNLVKVWDVVSNKEVKTIRAHDDAVLSIKYSPNGRYLVTSSLDSTIKIWNAYNYTLLQTIKTRKPESVVIFTPDSRKILSGGRDSLIKLWDPLTKTLLKTYKKHKGRITDLIFHPNDPTTFLSSSYDSMVYEWNIDSAKTIGWFKERSRILEIKLSNNALYMATVATDSIVRVWKYDKRKSYFSDTIAVERTGSSRYYASPDFSPDGNYIVYTVPDKLLRINDLNTLRYKSYGTDRTAFLAGVHFSVDGNFMIERYNLGGQLSIVNFSNWSLENTNSLSWKPLKQYANPPINVQFSKDDKSLVVLCSNISKYSLANGTTEYMYTAAQSFNHKHLVLDNEDRSIYMGRSDRSVISYDYKRKQVTDTFRLSEDEQVTAFGITKRDSIVYLGGANGLMEGYEARNGRKIFSRRFEKRDSNSVKLIRIDTLHNRLYVTLPYNKIFVLHPLSGKVLDSISMSEAFDIAATPKYVYVSGGHGRLNKYNAQNHKLEKSMVLNKIDVAVNLLKMSYDYTRLAIINTANIITVLNTTNDKVAFETRDHDFTTSAIDISHDNKFLATAGFDNKVNLYHLKTGKPIVTIHTPLDEDFLASDPEGYYMASKKSLDGVVFNFKNNAFSFEQFDLQFNRPDIILSKLGKADTALVQSYYAAYKRRLKKLGLTEEQVKADIHLPLVRILDKYSVRPTTTTNTFDVSIECYDSKYPLQTLHVFVNNAPVFGQKGRDIFRENTSNVVEKVTVPLSLGNNLVKIYCINERGTSSLKESFEIFSNYKTDVQPKTYFIGIAVADYKDSTMNLTYSAKDVRDLAASFKKVNANAEIDTLINAKATKENIVALRQKLLQTNLNDKVVMAVTGHGLLSDSLDFYYATYDVDFKNPVQRGLKYEDLENLLDAIPARQKLLLIDACHSGALDKETLLAQNPVVKDDKGEGVKAIGTRSSIKIKQSKVSLNNTFELMQNLFADLSNNNGTVVISAAGGLEYAFESPQWNNGVFTYCVRKGLEERQADYEGNVDGKVSVQELQQYVSRQVSALTNGRQRPTSRRENFDYDWSIR